MFQKSPKLNKIAYQMNFKAPVWSDRYFADTCDYWVGVHTGSTLLDTDIFDGLSSEVVNGITQGRKPLLIPHTCIETAMVNPFIRQADKFKDNPMACFQTMEDFKNDTGLICTYLRHARFDNQKKNLYYDDTVLVCYSLAEDKGPETDLTKTDHNTKYIFLAWCEQQELITTSDLEDLDFMHVIEEDRHLQKVTEGRSRLHVLMNEKSEAIKPAPDAHLGQPGPLTPA